MPTTPIASLSKMETVSTRAVVGVVESDSDVESSHSEGNWAPIVLVSSEDNKMDD